MRARMTAKWAPPWCLCMLLLACGEPGTGACAVSEQFCPQPVTAETRAPTATTHYRIDSAHTGVVVDPAIRLPLVQKWQVQFSGRPSYALAYDGFVFVAARAPDQHQHLYALRPQTGDVGWSADLGASAGALLAGDTGRIVTVDRPEFSNEHR